MEDRIRVARARAAKEWHQTKNGELTPDQVTPGNNNKVWWICERSHEWPATIQSRTSGSGCPICYDFHRSEIQRKAALKRSGSLAEKFPELIKEWHPTKNKDLKPEQVPFGSHLKVWWKCSQNQKHVWPAEVRTRTKGHGCPFCSGRYPSEEYNLAVVLPNLAKEWHPTKNDITPYQVTPGSSQKVWWICERGHEWPATVSDRKRGQGCPKCKPSTSRLEIRVFSELKSIFEDTKWLANIDGLECDILLPTHNICIEVDGYPWHDGNEERDKLKGIELGKKGVKVFRVRDEQLKKITDTDIFYRSRESHFLIIVRLLKNLVKYLSFAQDEKVKIENYVESNRLQNDLVFRRMLSNLPSPPPEQSLEALFPKLAGEWNYEKNMPLEPRMFSPGSHKKVFWTCSEDPDHEWPASILNRTNGSGCPYCAGTLASKKYNLSVEYPAIAKEWHPTKNGELTPDQVTPGSEKKVWWICPNDPDHDYPASIYNRVKGSGCPYCPSAKSGRRASKGYNLLVEYPEIAREWHPTKNHPVKPSDITPSSSKKLYWKCSKYPEHEWQDTPYHRTGMNTGCPYCSGSRVSDLNSIASKFPELAKEWHSTRNENLTPDQISFGSIQKVWWKCEKGHEWSATPNSRSRGSNCPECAKKKRVETRRKILIQKHGSVADHYPELVKEWHPTKNGDLTPFDFTTGSREKVWWRCKEGHEWVTTIASRVSGRGCLKCYNARRGKTVQESLLKKRGSLSEKYPELSLEWHPLKNGDLTPSNIYYGSGRRVWWMDKDGREWQAVIRSRVKYFRKKKN